MGDSPHPEAGACFADLSQAMGERLLYSSGMILVQPLQHSVYDRNFSPTQNGYNMKKTAPNSLAKPAEWIGFSIEDGGYAFVERGVEWRIFMKYLSCRYRWRLLLY